MNRHHILPAVWAAGILCMLPVDAARAEKVTVGQNGLTTIQDAVDAVLANTDTKDTILVPAGVYEETVNVSFASLTTSNWQEKLTIRRTGVGEVRIEGQGDSPAIHLQDVDGVNLVNLTLKSGSALDGQAALRIDGQSQHIGCSNLSGVAGDDIGVAVVGSTVLGVRFESCDFSALLMVGFFIDGVGHSMTGCKANSCSLNGIVLATTSLNCVLKNCEAKAVNALASAEPGVITIHGKGHRLDGCEASGGNADGFFVAGEGHVVKDCDSQSNALSGYNVDGAMFYLKGCNAKSNLFGISGGGEGATIESGKVKNNASHGVFLMDSGTNVRSVDVRNNGGHGVYVVAGVVGTTVRKCKLKENGGEGVLVEGQLTWLEENKATEGDGLVDHGTFNGGYGNTVKDGGTNDF